MVYVLLTYANLNSRYPACVCCANIRPPAPGPDAGSSGTLRKGCGNEQELFFKEPNTLFEEYTDNRIETLTMS